ncbi:hypothetical protein RB595_004760 [Gaeumannomyces hyphopodioides]
MRPNKELHIETGRPALEGDFGEERLLCCRPPLFMDYNTLHPAHHPSRSNLLQLEFQWLDMDQPFYKAGQKLRTRETLLTAQNNAVCYGTRSEGRLIRFTDSDDGCRDDITKLLSAMSAMSLASIGPSSPKIAAARDSASDQHRIKTDVLYHALHSGSIFRVLEIEAGGFESPIICKFHHVDLDALHLKYDALSYVWGEPSWRLPVDNMRTFAVQCDGHELKISQNLHGAIRHVRSTSRQTFLWADAMCINQEDEAERGHQVSLMASIYRRARQTIAWLGYDESTRARDPFAPFTEQQRPEAQLAFGAICNVVNHWKSLKTAGAQGGIETASYRVANPADEEDTKEFSHFKRDQGSSNPEPEPFDPGVSADAASAKTSLLWKSIASLFSQAWFRRVWVVQEVVLAQLAVVRWGHAEIDWRWIGLAAAILRTNYSSICEAMKMGGVYNAYLMFRLSPMSDLPPLTLSFIQLLRLTRQLEVTDARDRIYGLLGIYTTDNDPRAGRLFLRPDYSISEYELWKHVAIKVISESQNLSLLSSVQYDTDSFEARFMFPGGRNPKQPLPSWVPNWNVAHRATLAPWDHNDQFAAAKNFPLHLGSPIGSNNLLVEGIQTGIIGKCYGTGWHQAVTALLEEEAMGGFFASDGGLRLLARTLTAGRNAYGSLTTADSGGDSDGCLADLAAYILDCAENERERPRKWPAHSKSRWARRQTKSYGIFEQHPRLKEELEKLTEGGNTSQFCSAVDSMGARRRLFITLNGYFGFGPDSLNEGDVVCVLSGADLPFVLRPVSQDSENTEQLRLNELPQVDHYLLVGECYIEGLMNGEAAVPTANGSDPLELFGPVPLQLLEDDIPSAANEPKRDLPSRFDFQSEVELMERKHVRLAVGNLFTPAMLKATRRATTEKRWFDIH